MTSTLFSPDLAQLATLTTTQAIAQWKKSTFAQLIAAINSPQEIPTSIYQRSDLTDALLKHLWQLYITDSSIGLFAVGGYGRGEMLPFSDVDIMLLSKNPLCDDTQNQVSTFVTSLWDIGLEPGVSVRTIAQCLEAADDITVATTLVECRLITGNPELTSVPRQIVSEGYNDAVFFDAKKQEQTARYAKHNNTEYNLEPDVKNAPGGLRDIHQIGWVAKRHFRVKRFYDLVHLGFLTEYEYNDLKKSELFLWQIRHALHIIAGRNENRLLFDYQHQVANMLGYTLSAQEHANSVIERLMRDYYRCAMKVSTLNEMLLAYFYESVIEAKLSDDQKPQHRDYNQYFKVVGNQLAVKDHKVFAQYPSSIFQVFEIMALDPTITGIRARTHRLLMLAANRIDQQFRQDPVNKAMFINIINMPKKLFIILKDMKRYGILGKYIPAFGKIIGLMQYDLFHVYTVDAHTLVLVRNLQRFADAKYSSLFPKVSEVYERVERKDLLMLAAIFHDIAKGRGGDHSVIGAVDAFEFCKLHDYSTRDANIVAWLTRNHLLMSLTAQKQDVSDPEVIEEFANVVGDEVHLDLLYCLTVADINATNTNLWNGWKASLLQQLYSQTRRVLRRGLGNPIDRIEWIESNKAKARTLLGEELQHHPVIDNMWQEFGEDYFLREQPRDIAWHTKEIILHGLHNPKPLVMLEPHSKLSQDAVQIFIYTQDAPNLFAATVATLVQLNLTILDARIMDSKQKYCLDTYIVLDLNQQLTSDKARQAQVITALKRALANPEAYPAVVKQRTPRQIRHFNVVSEVRITASRSGLHQVLEIMTRDRPGILAEIGSIFAEQRINILSAKIATLGERVEDVFFITRVDGSLLDAEQSAQLCTIISQTLDNSQ